MTRFVRWLVIGPAALVALVAIVAGGPVLLLKLGGNPLPDHVLSPGEVGDLLTRPDDGRLLLWALSVVGWAAWAAVAGSVLLELGAQLTGRRTPHVPGLAGPQRLAGLLVAGVLAALTTPGMSQAQAAYLDQPVAAAEYLPQPVAQTAIVEVEDEPLVHEVAKGDWMWHIAGRYLGEEERYPEIAALNPGYEQRYEDFPDHIQPGDELVLPEDAYDRGERGHATGELIGDDSEEPPQAEAPPATEAPPPATEAPTQAPPTEAPPPTETPEATTPPAETTAPPGGTGTQPPPQEAAPAPLPIGGKPEPGDQDQGQDQGQDLVDDAAALGPAMLVCAGVLASVLVGALVLYRVRKLARRRYRRTITGAANAEAEATLRAAATTDVARLDQALRMLSAALATDGAEQSAGSRPGPDIGAVWIGEGEIHLILTTPTDFEPPAPFYATGTGSWFLPADAVLPDVAGAIAPLPALVTIGSQPGQHLLIDLERMGMLTITGHQQRCGDLLRYLVAELAHNPWSDRVEVTLAGFPPETAGALARLNPDRITVAGSLPEAAGKLRHRLAHTTAALDAHGLADSIHGRISDTATDTWIPHLLLIDRPRPEHDELLAELEAALTEAGRRCAVAVATTAPPGVPYGRRAITITDDGMLKAGFLHESHPLPAVALPEHLLAPLADLLRDAAEGEDHPIPPATEVWAGDTDVTGSIRLPEPSPPAPDHNGRGGGGAMRLGTPVQLPIIGPAVYDDPDLDRAVAEWHGDADEVPRIALLGPIRVTGAGPPPSHRARVCRELIVYLAACGDRGADPGEIDRQLWSNQRVTPAIRTEVMATARRWLGNGPQGEPWLPEVGIDGRYRLRGGILVDWHLFRRLRTRGERRGLAGAEDLRTALQLIRGAPLQDAHQLAAASTRAPYSWLAGSVIEPDLILAGILDTAHELVGLCLTTGDLDTARWAVQQTWLADLHRGDDHPWRDLLRVARARGDHDEVRGVVADLLRWRDAEHPDELAPDTQRLIRRCLRAEPASRTSLVANQPTSAGDRR